MTWVTLSSSTPTTWSARTANALPFYQTRPPVSVETRLNRVYPQREALGDVPFIWRIQSTFPFYVATGSGVFIRSSITEALY